MSALPSDSTSVLHEIEFVASSARHCKTSLQLVKRFHEESSSGKWTIVAPAFTNSVQFIDVHESRAKSTRADEHDVEYLTVTTKLFFPFSISPDCSAEANQAFLENDAPMLIATSDFPLFSLAFAKCMSQTTTRIAFYETSGDSRLCERLSEHDVNFAAYSLRFVHVGNGEKVHTFCLCFGALKRVAAFRVIESSKRLSVVPAQQVDVAQHLPEVTDSLTDSVISFAVRYDDEAKRSRTVVLGYESGLVEVFQVANGKILSRNSVEHISPVTTVNFWNAVLPVSRSGLPVAVSGNSGESSLIACSSAIDGVFLYDPANLDRPFGHLARSNEFDTVTSSAVFDFDLDGIPEFAVTTFGGALFVYKRVTRPLRRLTSGQRDRIDSGNDLLRQALADMQPDAGSDRRTETVGSVRAFANALETHSDALEYETFELIFERQFGVPLFAVGAADLTGDGVRELVVLSVAGVHILQYDVDFIQATLRLRASSLETP